MKKTIIRKTSKLLAGIMMSATMVAGIGSRNVKAASDDWVTYYNDEYINQLACLCTVSYTPGTYTATVTNVSGTGYDKITPANGTGFRGSTNMVVSNVARTANVYVNKAASNGTAQFVVTLCNYSRSTLINGRISR